MKISSEISKKSKIQIINNNLDAPKITFSIFKNLNKIKHNNNYNETNFKNNLKSESKVKNNFKINLLSQSTHNFTSIKETKSKLDSSINMSKNINKINYNKLSFKNTSSNNIVKENSKRNSTDSIKILSKDYILNFIGLKDIKIKAYNKESSSKKINNKNISVKNTKNTKITKISNNITKIDLSDKKEEIIIIPIKTEIINLEKEKLLNDNKKSLYKNKNILSIVNLNSQSYKKINQINKRQTSHSVKIFFSNIEKKIIKSNSIGKKSNPKISLKINPTSKIITEAKISSQSLNNSTSRSTSKNFLKNEELCKSSTNLIYDDELGNYIIKVGDIINERYEIISELGTGSFGQAIKCTDRKTNEQVCVKIIKNELKFSDQGKIEIKLLTILNDSTEDYNIVKMYEHFIFRGHICIVFELLDLNLYEYLKSRDFNGLELSTLKKIAFQILNSLIFLKKNKIIHCDLKPENILLKLNSNDEVKLIDFGSSCSNDDKLYIYLQSRFYRSPEIILELPYGVEIDMWSLGCILVEMFVGIPIFPGENEKDQLDLMMEYLGFPPIELLEQSNKTYQFFDEDLYPLNIPNSYGKVRVPNTKKLNNFLKLADESFIDFIKKCLVWNPSERIKPEEAILHNWITMEQVSQSKNITKNEIKNKSNHFRRKSYKEIHFGNLSKSSKHSNTLKNYENISYSARKNYDSIKAKINLTLDINYNLQKRKNEKLLDYNHNYSAKNSNRIRSLNLN